MDLRKFEEALLPYEKKLQVQEKLRRFLGVKEVDRPTYENYIIGPIERFDHRKKALMSVTPDIDSQKEFKPRIGQDNFMDRICLSMGEAAWRPCSKYSPETLPLALPEHKVGVSDKVWMTRMIKKVALLFGAEMVRITKVDRRWIYQNVEIPHKYAIVLVVSHARSLNATAPSLLSFVSAGDTYSRLKFITTMLADFICGLGYGASYRETLAANPEMLMVPTAIDAGIGEFARNGRVLSPEFGINMRLKAVTTDMPLEVDKPISFGVHEFCMACENCAAYCPSNAIPFGPPTDDPPTIHNNPGFRKWYIHADRCLTTSAKKTNWRSYCGRCISVCPWNKPLSSFHNMVRWTAIHCPSVAKKMLAWGDRVVYRRKKAQKENS